MTWKLKFFWGEKKNQKIFRKVCKHTKKYRRRRVVHQNQQTKQHSWINRNMDKHKLTSNWLMITIGKSSDCSMLNFIRIYLRRWKWNHWSRKFSVICIRKCLPKEDYKWQCFKCVVWTSEIQYAALKWLNSNGNFSRSLSQFFFKLITDNYLLSIIYDR